MNTTALTDNGALTNYSSKDYLVDAFFLVGASRNMPIKDKVQLFENALAQDPGMAIRLLFWSRDIRGGIGERSFFRQVFTHLAKTKPDSIKNLVKLIPEYGRWDDLLVLFDTQLETKALETIKDGIMAENGLCAKWMPRKGLHAIKLRNYLNLSPKQYRKLLVRLSNTVETKMCANEWDKIEFGHVPSVAHARYRKAFKRHDEERYVAYLEDVKSGKNKVNAKAIYPHDILRGMISYNGMNHINEVVKNSVVTQWDALPNYLEDNTSGTILPIVDISGSMWFNSTSGNVYPGDIAVSLGVYVAERNEGPFKDQLISFSETPRMFSLTGDVINKVNQVLNGKNMGYSTNLEKTFQTLLDVAVKNKLSEDDMPKSLLIFSDMEFNEATMHGYGREQTNFESIEELYRTHGYTRPNIIFWNLNGRMGNVPVTFDQNGTALVSGFSPVLMKNLLSGKGYDPRDIVNDVLMNERYDIVESLVA